MIKRQRWYDRSFGIVISKRFNFPNVQSLIKLKLKTKSSQRIDGFKYKIDTANDGNLRPNKMYKIFI